MPADLRVSTVLAATAAVLAGGWPAQPPAGAAGKDDSAREIRWAKSYDAALKQARKARRPVLIEFYADWCGPCQQMARTTFRHPDVVRLSRRFVPVRVNVDREPRLARKFRVASLPYAVILTPEGRLHRALVGYQDAKGFSLFLLQGLP